VFLHIEHSIRTSVLTGGSYSNIQFNDRHSYNVCGVVMVI